MNGTNKILVGGLVLALMLCGCALQSGDASQGDLSIDNCSFDPSTGILSFEGSAADDLVKLYVEDLQGTRVTSYYSYPVDGGSFEGMMNVRSLEDGDYRLVAFQNAGGGGVKSVRITVSIGTTPVSGITLDRESVTITAADSVKLNATLLPEGAAGTVSWGSANPRFVEVSQDGTLIPRLYTGDQSVEVTAQAGGYRAVCLVKVGYAQTGMSPASISIVQGGSGTISATVPQGYENAQVTWKTSSGHVAVEGSGGTATIRGLYVGDTTVTAVIGGLFSASCDVTVTDKPATSNTYTFYLRILSEADAQKASYGSSGLTANDLLRGITFSGTGSNAGEALESCLRANRITCDFWSGGDIKYWVNQILGLKQVQYANGDWKYWIQYKDGTYNDWTLGWYTEGGSFSLIYGITSEDGQVVDPGTHQDDEPGQDPIIVINPDNSRTITTVVTNPDGSTITTVENVKTEKGTDGSTMTLSDKETTYRNVGDEVTGKVRTQSTTVTYKDGSSTITFTETSSDGQGTVLSVVEGYEEYDKSGDVVYSKKVTKDRDGNDVSTCEETFDP